MKNIKEIIASPFRNADKINRQVIIDYLPQLDGNYLEVGPGSRPILEDLPHIATERKVIIDLPEMTAHCQALGYTCLAQNAGMEKWQIEDESIDVVLSNQCLEHIPNTDHFIAEAYRVLKKNGFFLISVPNQGALAFIFLMLLTINPPMNFVSDRFYGLGNPLSNNRWNERNVSGHSHLRLFMTRAMNDLLKVYGFKILRNHGGSWGLPILGRSLARIFPYYGLFTTVLAEKV